MDKKTSRSASSPCKQRSRVDDNENKNDRDESQRRGRGRRRRWDDKPHDNGGEDEEEERKRQGQKREVEDVKRDNQKVKNNKSSRNGHRQSESDEAREKRKYTEKYSDKERERRKHQHQQQQHRYDRRRESGISSKGHRSSAKDEHDGKSSGSKESSSSRSKDAREKDGERERKHRKRKLSFSPNLPSSSSTSTPYPPPPSAKHHQPSLLPPTKIDYIPNTLLRDTNYLSLFAHSSTTTTIPFNVTTLPTVTTNVCNALLNAMSMKLSLSHKITLLQEEEKQLVVQTPSSVRQFCFDQISLSIPSTTRIEMLENVFLAFRVAAYFVLQYYQEEGRRKKRGDVIRRAFMVLFVSLRGLVMKLLDLIPSEEEENNPILQFFSPIKKEYFSKLEMVVLDLAPLLTQFLLFESSQQQKTTTTTTAINEKHASSFLKNLASLGESAHCKKYYSSRKEKMNIVIVRDGIVELFLHQLGSQEKWDEKRLCKEKNSLIPLLEEKVRESEEKGELSKKCVEVLKQLERLREKQLKQIQKLLKEQKQKEQRLKENMGKTELKWESDENENKENDSTKKEISSDNEGDNNEEESINDDCNELLRLDGCIYLSHVASRLMMASSSSSSSSSPSSSPKVTAAEASATVVTKSKSTSTVSQSESSASQSKPNTTATATATATTSSEISKSNGDAHHLSKSLTNNNNNDKNNDNDGVTGEKHKKDSKVAAVISTKEEKQKEEAIQIQRRSLLLTSYYLFHMLMQYNHHVPTKALLTDSDDDDDIEMNEGTKSNGSTSKKKMVQVKREHLTSAVLSCLLLAGKIQECPVKITALMKLAKNVPLPPPPPPPLSTPPLSLPLLKRMNGDDTKKNKSQDPLNNDNPTNQKVQQSQHYHNYITTHNNSSSSSSSTINHTKIKTPNPNMIRTYELKLLSIFGFHIPFLSHSIQPTIYIDEFCGRIPEHFDFKHVAHHDDDVSLDGEDKKKEDEMKHDKNHATNYRKLALHRMIHDPSYTHSTLCLLEQPKHVVAASYRYVRAKMKWGPAPRNWENRFCSDETGVIDEYAAKAMECHMRHVSKCTKMRMRQWMEWKRWKHKIKKKIEEEEKIKKSKNGDNDDAAMTEDFDENGKDDEEMTVDNDFAPLPAILLQQPQLPDEISTLLTKINNEEHDLNPKYHDYHYDEKEGHLKPPQQQLREENSSSFLSSSSPVSCPATPIMDEVVVDLTLSPDTKPSPNRMSMNWRKRDYYEDNYDVENDRKGDDYPFEHATRNSDEKGQQQQSPTATTTTTTKLSVRNGTSRTDSLKKKRPTLPSLSPPSSTEKTHDVKKKKKLSFIPKEDEQAMSDSLDGQESHPLSSSKEHVNVSSNANITKMPTSVTEEPAVISSSLN